MCPQSAKSGATEARGYHALRGSNIVNTIGQKQTIPCLLPVLREADKSSTSSGCGDPTRRFGENTADESIRNPKEEPEFSRMAASVAVDNDGPAQECTAIWWVHTIVPATGESHDKRIERHTRPAGFRLSR